MPDQWLQRWIDKAEEDWTGLARLGAGGWEEVADIAAFLAQQCAEKYLKALIHREGLEPPRLHHLPMRLDLLLLAHPDLAVLRESCERLSPYAVSFRYPGEDASAQEARDGMELAGQIRQVLRAKLGVQS